MLGFEGPAIPGRIRISCRDRCPATPCTTPSTCRCQCRALHGQSKCGSNCHRKPRPSCCHIVFFFVCLGGVERDYQHHNLHVDAYVWVNYSDLTRPHAKWWFMWGISPEPPYRLGKSYDSPRHVLWVSLLLPTWNRRYPVRRVPWQATSV